eukprot:TRINITY_DN59923_c0_g2_i1.p1 TRINITY_DN59923_c0_g2~~TRINITY_DN59923_c0_g2_i1.p1  ORF type:complete len:518 (+),score=47.33 TRINITY_DN59923_c0_g2_i1:99-1556(+)
MTNEPPKGLRSNVSRSYHSFSTDLLEMSCQKRPQEFKKLLFAYCLFHACIQERRKFGALGFNIAYEFTNSDLNMNVKQLVKFLNNYDDIPYPVLKFLVGQINYGGRVTDDWDRRCLMSLLNNYIGPPILEEGYQFSAIETYQTIAPGNQAYYLEHIASWPINVEPEVFGLHANADITCARNEASTVMSTMLLMQTGVSGGAGKSRDAILAEMAEDLSKRCPAKFDIDALMRDYPTRYEQSMNTVLVQEAGRFNRLLNVMHSSLKELKRAISGLVAFSQELEIMGTSMFNNQVPAIWAARSYPSLRSLSAWFEDLIKRCAFITHWYKNGHPSAYWVSGFFFPQAFLTGTLQNYARKFQVSIDTISFGFEIMKEHHSKIEKPEDGAVIYGVFMEGAQWSAQDQVVVESRPKELFTEMPAIWLRPEVNREKPTEGIYNCPLYKTLRRAGTLSTSGHSTNFVIAFELPSDKPEAHWVGRAVACFCEVIQ